MDTFFHYLSPFSDFLSNQIHKARISSWFLEAQSSTIYFIYGLLLLSRAPQDSIDATVSKSFISSSVYVRTAKISYSKNDISHNNYLYPSNPNVIGKFSKIALSKITSNWLREEGTSGPFYFIFKNVLFFIYCTEQNTKEIIWLRRCYLLIKTWSILKWYGSAIFLKQLSSNYNRLVPKTSVKSFLSNILINTTISKMTN